MKKPITVLVGFTIVLLSFNASAVSLSFSFDVPLTVTTCVGLSNCSNPPDGAAILIELEIDDPYLTDQIWSTDDVVSYEVVGFPVVSPVTTAFRQEEFLGTYTVDAVSGLATSTLTDYYLLVSDPGISTMEFDDTFAWQYQDRQGYIQALPGAPTDAFTQLPPVPIPATAWLFGSAILGLVSFKRNNA